MKFQGLATNVNAIDPQEVKEALAEGADSAFGSITRSCLCYSNLYYACSTQTHVYSLSLEFSFLLAQFLLLKMQLHFENSLCVNDRSIE